MGKMSACARETERTGGAEAEAVTEKNPRREDVFLRVCCREAHGRDLLYFWTHSTRSQISTGRIPAVPTKRQLNRYTWL